MKKLLLTVVTTCTLLFAQAQCPVYFSYTQSGSTTVFTNLSPLSSLNTWSWDFGDGNTSTLQNPTHTYSNGIYSPCLTATLFDTTTGFSCTAIYCDSILIGNGQTASWDCNPNMLGCFDPGTGLGQYTSLSACQSACSVTNSWDCSPVSGCYDPGTGQGAFSTYSSCDTACTMGITNFACMGGVAPGVTSCVGPGNFVMGTTYVMGVYSTMAACIADSCNVTVMTTSWDCDPLTGCYDPGTGNGQYSTFSACQSVCTPVFSLPCDSMTATGTQFQITMGVNIPNTIIDYWVTTALNSTVLQVDSSTNIHTVYQNTLGMPYDTLITCIDYSDATGYSTCCVTWIWDAGSGSWARMGSVTSVVELNLDNKNLIKIVDVLGRETFPKSNEILFYIYEDGTIEKKYIAE